MKKGFTLIELLIVIALLGTLAVALLAAIDPFEQFRKGTDTGVRNTTQEIFNAAIRYYSLRGGWPDGWIFSNTASAISTLTGTDSEGNAINTIISPLMDAGELKDNFIELAGDNLAKIYISKQTEALDDSHIAVCFKPESKAFQNADSNTKFSEATYQTGINQPLIDPETENTTEACKLNGGEKDCYWCVY